VPVELVVSEAELLALRDVAAKRGISPDDVVSAILIALLPVVAAQCVKRALR
jgi:hypothetical protein